MLFLYNYRLTLLTTSHNPDKSCSRPCLRSLGTTHHPLSMRTRRWTHKVISLLINAATRSNGPRAYTASTSALGVCKVLLGRTVTSCASLCKEGLQQLSLGKAESRENGKEKNERHKPQSNLAQGCALAMACTFMWVVQYGLTLIAHGVHDPP